MSVRVLFRALASLLLMVAAVSARAGGYSVLVLCSYNPGANSQAAAINNFERELHDRGVEVSLSVESMSIEGFAEAGSWRLRMMDILAKYKSHDVKPDYIVLLGQEALATYLSLDVSDIPDVPVLCGGCSRNYVEIPAKLGDIGQWEPESLDVVDASSLYNIVGGHFYEYDVAANVRLIGNIFPRLRNIVFLSDNSYGGVNMRALVRSVEGHFGDYRFDWLDGRGLTILSAADVVAAMPDSAALLIGTWRYDRDNRFYVSSSISMLKQNKETLPVFTLSSAGLKDWAIGGYIPQYGNVGRLLAHSFIDFLATGKANYVFIPSHYVFNYEAMTSFGITDEELPEGSEIVNQPTGFLMRYLGQIVAIILIFVALAAALVFSVRRTRRIRRLQMSLEQNQRDLVRAKERAEANSLLKTSFLADMAHEIRTPLNAVLGFSQVVATQGDTLDAAERERVVDIINKNSAVLLDLLNDILDISRIESGRARFDIEDVDLVAMCREAVAQVKAGNPDCVLAFRIETDLGAFPFRTDRRRLEQVVAHLLSNAVKFTKEGSVGVTLRRLADGGAMILVSDTGRGIPPDKAERVFARFVKLDEYSSGTGLGLSLCRMVVERLGGKIWVDTSYTRGAQLVLSLPIVDETLFQPALE